MTARQVGRVIAAVVAVTLLIALALMGITGGLAQWPHWSTFATRVQTIAQIVGGTCAVLMLVTRFRWQWLHRATEAGFVVTSVVAAGLAPVVWGGQSFVQGLLAALVALVVVGLIVWLFRVGAGTYGLQSNPEG